jgi:hypothetical protein
MPSSFLGNRGDNLCLVFFVIRDSLLKPSEALPRTIHAYQNAAFLLGAQITHSTTRTRTLLGSRSHMAYIGSFTSFEFRTSNNKCLGKYRTSGNPCQAVSIRLSGSC